ncbi:MAG: MATE family efflux transporter [Burkholderiaceae bacterium]|nr:MATE family efflux transporter [Burkholderiaceae bacterium]
MLILPARPLWQSFLVFLGPLLVANILQSLSGTINNIYLGQMIGVKALAAVSSFSPILFFFIAFAIGLGAGASVLIGQAWGARQVDVVRSVAGSTLTLGLSLGLVIAVGGSMFVEPMLRALGTPPDILHDATRVARILLVTMPGLFLFVLSTSMLRGVGDTVTPLYTLLLSTLIGLILTPALIRGWFGLPRMGVASGAWAGVVSLVVGTLWVMWYLRHKNSPLKPDADLLRRMRLDMHLLKNVLRIGVPAGIQMIVGAISDLALLTIINSYGSNATAAYGAIIQVVIYAQVPAISISIATSILGAQAIGAGRTGQLSIILRTAMWLNLVFTGALVVLAYLLSHQLMATFITSAPVVNLAQTLLYIMLWSQVVLGMALAISGVMRASGTVWVPMLITIGCIALVQQPTAWIVSRHIGLNGVPVAYPAAYSAILLLQWVYYRTVWRKRTIKRMV